MRTRLPLTVLLLAVMTAPAALPGCQGNPANPAAAGPTTQPIIITDFIRPDERLPVVQLDVLTVTVPKGAVSRSEEFWKRVDEQRVDPATYDLLLKNGVRVGVGTNADWADYFRDLFERHNARASRGSVMAGGAGSLQLSMKKNIGFQDIFYLNDQNQMHGQPYHKCENLLGVSFWPEPRQVGALHLTVTPTVRATRSRWEVKRNGEENEIVEVRPEYLYDLNLRTIIPPDCFLVVAPSVQAKRPTSLGNAFLTSDGDAEQREQVLVFVPRNIRQGDPMMRPAVGMTR